MTCCATAGPATSRAAIDSPAIVGGNVRLVIGLPCFVAETWTVGGVSIPAAGRALGQWNQLDFRAAVAVLTSVVGAGLAGRLLWPATAMHAVLTARTLDRARASVPRESDNGNMPPSSPRISDPRRLLVVLDLGRSPAFPRRLPLRRSCNGRYGMGSARHDESREYPAQNSVDGKVAACAAVSQGHVRIVVGERDPQAPLKCSEHSRRKPQIAAAGSLTGWPRRRRIALCAVALHDHQETVAATMAW